MTYKEFLESKIELATDSGFVVEPERINKALKPHQKDAVAWALKGGRRALFESFGLGKSKTYAGNKTYLVSYGEDVGYKDMKVNDLRRHHPQIESKLEKDFNDKTVIRINLNHE